MITLSTYISILIPSILTIFGFYITIQASHNIEKKKKNKLNFLISLLLIIVFLLLTFLFCYQRYTFNLLYLNKFFPFSNNYFEDINFYKNYNFILFISLGLHIIIYSAKMYFNSIRYKMFILPFFIFLYFLVFLIISYLFIWYVYLMMFLLFNKIPLWLFYSLTASISFCISILFSLLGCYINDIYFYKHAPKWKYEQSISLLNAEIAKCEKEIEELQKK